MEPDKIIEAFTQVVREQDHVFSDAAIADIPFNSVQSQRD